MQKILFSCVLALAVLAAMPRATPAGQTPGTAPQTPPPAAQPGSGQSGYVLKVKTRLVTLDVIATDSRGNAVRDLKPEELQIFERNEPQKIAAFEFIDHPSTAAAAEAANRANAAPKVYSNLLHFQDLPIPPTVLLMDALNTPLEDQLRARTEMIRLLRTLPAGTPVSVFLLGGGLRLVQDFTTDPALLQKAIGRLIHPDALEKNPIDDRNSVSNMLLMNTGDVETDETETLENFEKEQYANTVDLRAHLTLASLAQISRYFSGVPGRKNLLWISESFPLTLSPDLDNGNLPFEGTREYASEVEAAANALSDAQVAIYPVDLRGLQTDETLAASEDDRPRFISGGLSSRVTPANGDRGPNPASRNLNGGGLPLDLEREEDARIEMQQTMGKLASETGGRTCEEINNLGDCIAKALKDGSSYYELAYYPQATKWDGKFHPVVVKTTRRGVRLVFRQGYFALDAEELARKQTAEEQLRQACSDLLPATAIHLMAQAVPTDAGTAANGRKYLLLIDPLGLNFQPNGTSFNFAAEAASCQFGNADGAFHFEKQDLTRTITNETYQTWQAHGIPDYITVTAPTGINRVRFAVVDASTGLTGALDVALEPAPAAVSLAAPAAEPPNSNSASTQETAAAASSASGPAAAGENGSGASSVAPPAEASSPAATPLAIKTTPTLAIPDDRTQPQPRPIDHLTLRGNAGETATLDWTAGTLTYQGNLAIVDGAPAFFQYAFGANWRCQSGDLVAADGSRADPRLQLIFWNAEGKSVTVYLKGGAPRYIGDLPLDESARLFFDRVWQVSHCLAK